MYSFLQPLHSYLAWLLLITIALTLVLALLGKYRPVNHAQMAFRTAKVAFIFSHIQLLMGTLFYFVSPLGLSNLSGATMSDSLGRLVAVEHPLTNILAIVLITIGYAKMKKSVGQDGTKVVLIYYGIGLLLLLSRIPYQNWLS
ncbi:MAG: cytochrome B [Saprospiraceae bacterium]